MSKQANPAVIGGFVLGALLLFIGALIAFGSGALWRERIALVTFFPGSVQGLNIGAQVQFQGVPIGQVTSIGLDYLPDANGFRVSVRYDIWPRNVAVLDGAGETDPRDILRRLIEEKGLRARTQSVSLVTGQYVVNLGLNPHLQGQSKARDERGAIEVPATEATRDRVEDLLTNLPLDEMVSKATGILEAIRHLFASGKPELVVTQLGQTLSEAQQLLATLNQNLEPMLDQFERLLRSTDDLVVVTREHIETLAPALTDVATKAAQLTTDVQRDWPALASAAHATLAQLQGTLAELDALVAQDSPTRHQLDQLLAQGTQAARSIRTLADYLERHPEALLSGKSAR